MVKVVSVRGLRAVVGVVGTTGSGTVGDGEMVTDVGVVTTARGGAVVVGEASDPAAVVGVVVEAAAEEPAPALERELDDEAIDATGATDFPDRSGAFSGGVSSGRLALDMNRLKIWAGSDPPLTLATPWTFSSGLDWPSG